MHPPLQVGCEILVAALEQILAAPSFAEQTLVVVFDGDYYDPAPVLDLAYHYCVWVGLGGCHCHRRETFVGSSLDVPPRHH